MLEEKRNEVKVGLVCLFNPEILSMYKNGMLYETLEAHQMHYSALSLAFSSRVMNVPTHVYIYSYLYSYAYSYNQPPEEAITSLKSKRSNRIRKYIHIIRKPRDTHAVQIDHADRTDSVQIVDVDVFGFRALDAEDTALAAVAVDGEGACCLFIVD